MVLAGEADESFKIVSEEITYDRYLTMYNRKVQFAEHSKHQGKAFEYDVIGHPRNEFHYAISFPYHSPVDGGEPHVTIIREYCQGPNRLLYNLPTGGFESKKHSSFEECARMELSEEAHLTGGETHKLIPDGHTGIFEAKWGLNQFTPFLFVDAQHDDSPLEADDEESIQVIRVSIKKVRELMCSGNMLLPAVTCCIMAIKALDDMGLST